MDKFNKALKDYNVAKRTTYDCLKDEQIDVINAILKSDILAILPTGFGKSLIYQILPFIEQCIVIVLFPLNSILYEQKGRLKFSCLHC